MPTVLALGLYPAYVTLPSNPELTPQIIRAYIDAKLDRVRAAGCTVQSCLVDLGDTAEAVVARELAAQSLDCIVIGAGLRAPESLRLFEKFLNLVHAQAPHAKVCFNSRPADTAEAVQRWV